MKFEEVLPALRKGGKIRKPGWMKGRYIQYRMGDEFVFFNSNVIYKSFASVLDEDWEIVDDTLSFDQLELGKLYKIVSINLTDIDSDFVGWVGTIVIRCDCFVGGNRQGLVVVSNSNYVSFTIQNSKMCRFIPVKATFEDQV